MKLLENLPLGSRIAVIRLRSLGDCVLTTPALSLLKRHRPDLKLSVVVEPKFAEIFAGNPDIDETRDSMTRADLVLNLHGGTRSMVLTALSRAKFRAGFAHHRYSFLYSNKIPTAQEILGVSRRVHTAEHLASAMFWLGVPHQPIPRAKLFADPAPDRRPYAVIHPFAARPDKTWPADRFIEVARSLPLDPIFLAGPTDDLSPFKDFETSRAPLNQTKSLISRASLFIGNDSGPAHIAAAFGIPVVVLFGPSDPVTWAPWQTESQILTAPTITAIVTDQVLTAALASRDQRERSLEKTRSMRELTRLLRYSRPYIPHLLASVIAMAIVGAAQAMTALLIQPILDRVLKPQEIEPPVKLFTFLHHTVNLNDFMPPHVTTIWSMVATAILTVFFFRGICDYFGNYLINYVGFSAVTDLRQTVFDRVVHQDAHFFEDNSTARVMSSIMNDLEKIQVALSHILADFLRQSFTVIGLLILVLQSDWKLAVCSLTVLPLVLVPTVRLGRRIRKTTRRAQDDAAELNQVLQEMLSGQQVVKSFGAEEIESNRFRDRVQRLRRSNLRYVAQQAISSPLIEFFGAVTIVGLVGYARLQIKAGAMSPGEFISFVIALLMLYEPVKRLTGIHNIFQQALGASQRVFEYLDREQQIKENPNAVKLARFEKAILFDGVGFHYPSAPNGFHLDNIHLEVKRGEIAALVGPSGSGKTTLANLVPRFYDVCFGAIRVDGKDIRDLRLDSLRDKISIVAQDTFLFNDTVANNIGYGRPGATREQIQDAARNALAEEFILRMPQSYDTMIGERGMKLSGGQRQRLAIARALLKDAPILILDEATSHLDTESERLVQTALQNLMEHRTVIVIAHRLSTIRRADKIVVLDRGKISEIGTHEELVAGGGIYQRLHDMQFLEDPIGNP